MSYSHMRPSLRSTTTFPSVTDCLPFLLNWLLAPVSLLENIDRASGVVGDEDGTIGRLLDIYRPPDVSDED